MIFQKMSSNRENKTWSEKIKRPPNAFMMFSSKRRKQLTGRGRMVSKILSDEWRALPEYEKQHYYNIAAAKKQEHKAMYPDYVYSPAVAREEKRKKKEERKQLKLAQELKIEAFRKSQKPQKIRKRTYKETPPTVGDSDNNYQDGAWSDNYRYQDESKSIQYKTEECQSEAEDPGYNYHNKTQRDYYSYQDKALNSCYGYQDDGQSTQYRTEECQYIAKGPDYNYRDEANRDCYSYQDKIQNGYYSYQNDPHNGYYSYQDDSQATQYRTGNIEEIEERVNQDNVVYQPGQFNFKLEDGRNIEINVVLPELLLYNKRCQTNDILCNIVKEVWGPRNYYPKCLLEKVNIQNSEFYPKTYTQL